VYVYPAGQVATGIVWNGPVCPTCGACYLGLHACSRDDLTRRVDELTILRDAAPVSVTPYPPGSDGYEDGTG
jgi:hypothetical protein